MTPIIHLKACPRCKGDMVQERDYWGEYLSCLTCGHIPYTTKRVIVKGLQGAFDVDQEVFVTMRAG